MVDDLGPVSHRSQSMRPPQSPWLLARSHARNRHRTTDGGTSEEDLLLAIRPFSRQKSSSSISLLTLSLTRLLDPKEMSVSKMQLIWIWNSFRLSGLTLPWSSIFMPWRREAWSLMARKRRSKNFCLMFLCWVQRMESYWKVGSFDEYRGSLNYEFREEFHGASKPPSLGKSDCGNHHLLLLLFLFFLLSSSCLFRILKGSGILNSGGSQDRQENPITLVSLLVTLIFWFPITSATK